jgi:hypothetical protein
LSSGGLNGLSSGDGEITMRNREITMGNRKMRNRKLCSRTSFRSVLGVAAAAAALIAMPMPNWASAVQSASAAEEGTVLYGFLPNPGLVSFDISWVDPNNRLYLLADRSNLSVDIVPIGPNPVGLAILGLFRLVPPGANGFAGTGGACGTNCAGPNGLITFTNPKSGTPELWVGDGPTANANCAPLGTCSTVKVFTVAGGQTPTHTISTVGSFRADELCFGDFGGGNHFVAIANDADLPSPFVSIINTDNYQVVTKINFDGNTAIPGTSGPNATNGIEQCQFDPGSNRFIINVPEVNGPGNDTVAGAVVSIDPVAATNAGNPVRGSFTVNVANCAGPQGMAIGPVGSDQVLLGCNAVSPSGAGGNGLQNSVIVELDTVTGDGTGPATILSTFVNQGGADQVWFNKGDGHYFLALGSHNPEMLGVLDSQPNTNGTLDADVFIGGGGAAPTRRNHSVAADAVTNLVAFPVAPVGAGFTSTVCGASAAQGCIAVFGPSMFDDNEGFEPVIVAE